MAGYRCVLSGLSDNTNEASLRSAFSRFGTILDVKVNYDPDTGIPLGSGSITFQDETAMNNAISSMNGTVLDGENITVRKPPVRPSMPSGGTGTGTGGGGIGGSGTGGSGTGGAGIGGSGIGGAGIGGSGIGGAGTGGVTKPSGGGGGTKPSGGGSNKPSGGHHVWVITWIRTCWFGCWGRWRILSKRRL